MTDNFFPLLATGSLSSLPVYGTATTAGIVFLVCLAGIFAFYKLLDELPKLSRRKLTDAQEVHYIKLITVIVFAALLSAGWDVWWHRAVGRDSLWELPHIFMYTLASIGVCLGLYAWQHTGRKIWKKIATALLLVPLSAPFDNFWHVLFGVEDLSRPISLSWSPPHMLLDLSVVATLVFLLSALHRHHKVKDEAFFASFIFGAITSLSLFLVMPFHPTEGWGQVAGFWGAGVPAAVFIGTMLAAQHWMKNSVAASMAALFSLILIFSSYGEETALGLILMPHDRPPIWLVIFAYLGSAALLDFTKQSLELWERAAAAAVIWALVLFVFAVPFFAPEFQYPIGEGLKALISSIAGATLAAHGYRYFVKA